MEQKRQQIFTKTTTLQTPKASICAAISANHGVFSYKRYPGSMNANDFKDFLDKLVLDIKNCKIPNPLVAIHEEDMLKSFKNTRMF